MERKKNKSHNGVKKRGHTSKLKTSLRYLIHFNCNLHRSQVNSSRIKKIKRKRDLKHNSDLNSAITKDHLNKLVLEIRLEFIITTILAFVGILLAFLK